MASISPTASAPTRHPSLAIVSSPAPLEVQNSARSLRDEAAIRLVQDGDGEALGLLFDRYSRLVLSVATKILRNPTEAQDVLQDVFVYIHQKRCTFNPSRGTLASWLLQIAHSKALSRHRKGLTAGVQADSTCIEEVAEEFPDSGTCPEGLSDQLSAQKILNVALPELPEHQRETLTMLFLEGYSLREISTKRGEGFGNTRYHYYRGLEALRGVLKVSAPR